jgi:hypothetical protein
MATAALVFALTGLLQTSAARPEREPTKILISGSHLGGLDAEVALSSELLTRLFSPLVVSEMKPLGVGGFEVPGRAWEIRDGRSKERLAAVFADPRGENWSVNVTSPRVRTAGGIGVGSPVKELLQTGIDKCRKVSEEQGFGISCWSARAANLTFMFTPSERELSALAGVEQAFDAGLVERDAVRKISLIVWSRPESGARR